MKKKITIASALLLATMTSQFLAPAYVNAMELELQVTMKKESSVKASKEIAEITEETTESGNNNSGENNGAVENKAIDLVAMHCDKNAIEKMGYKEQTVETEDTTANAAKEENEVIENEEPVEIIEQQEEVLPAA